MSQKELLEAIGQQVGLQTDRIRAEAEERAASIMRRAEAELGTIREGILEKARRDVVSEQAKIVNEARLRAKKELVAAKHDVIVKTLALLERKLDDLPSRKDYPEILGNQLAEAFDGVAGKAAVRCRRGDRKAVETWLARHKLEAAVEEADLPLGGVELRWGDRLQFIRRNSFRSRVDKILPDLLQEANGLVLGETAG